MTATIFALATPSGRAGIAVLRVSGPGAGSAIAALTRRPLPPARRASLRRLADPRGGEALDDALVLWFPGPNSFTGEDVAEFHIHGGGAVVAGISEVLGRLPGCRLAQAGEFTRRAFENGRLDLTEVEGLADLIAAETAAQRRQALRQLDGELGALYEGWRARLIRVLGHAEADIDFPDEDLPQGLAAANRPEIAALAAEIERHLDDGRRGERLRDGLSIAIIGAPNAGKSSLLNRLARRDAAIVSATAGTTRDVIEIHLDLGGYPVVIADTAGLRDSGDDIEAEGVRRALARAKAADLKLAVFDAAAWPAMDTATAALVDDDTIVVFNKIDLGPSNGRQVPDGRPAVAVSALTGAGVDVLLSAIEREAARRLDLSGSQVLTRARHREALDGCVAALRRGLVAALPELAAEDLRLAARSLGRITGRVGVDDILDVVFREFCIGK
ncbi:MAG: tRNA uridine-5-carboxymethylaminomethyl(34) synthesis GTPase MnmE [Rhodospirillaceae bacterium]|nr:tRNA uridine-5-carboxymethylaminomethyl(34) synthesis GTPase MnmE [Rhodospirillaceae bacterium]